MRDLKITQNITPNRNEDSLNRYLSDISHLGRLSAEEEVLLSKKIRAGDRAAEQKLITSNLRFVVSVAKKYQRMGMPLQDLVNEGNIGLIKAARKFDETKGFKFISYAVWWIRQSIIHALGEYSRPIRLPMNHQIGINRIRKQSARLEQELERDPTLEELEEVIGKPAGQLADYLKSAARIKYLEDQLPGGTSETNNLLEYIAHDEQNGAEDAVKKEAMDFAVKTLLQKLPKREQMVLILGYGLNGQESINHDAIAERLNLSKERIRQLSASAIRKLQSLHTPSFLKNSI